MSTSGTVLLVDDDPDVRDLLAFALGTAGYEIHTAEDGEAALTALTDFSPDLLIVDWVMPKVDGLELCSRLRSAAVGRDTPVIVVSGRAGAQDIATATGLGVVDYIPKPLSRLEVIRRSDRAVARARRGNNASAVRTADFGYAG